MAHELNRADRRRLARELRTGDDVAITDDVEILLHEPQHWHVDVVLYEYERAGSLVGATHFHGLITNDPMLAVSMAFKVAKTMGGAPRTEYRVEAVAQCADESHLIGIPDVDQLHRGHEEPGNGGSEAHAS